MNVIRVTPVEDLVTHKKFTDRMYTLGIWIVRKGMPGTGTFKKSLTYTIHSATFIVKIILPVAYNELRILFNSIIIIIMCVNFCHVL